MYFPIVIMSTNISLFTGKETIREQLTVLKYKARIHTHMDVCVLLHALRQYGGWSKLKQMRELHWRQKQNTNVHFVLLHRCQLSKMKGVDYLVRLDLQ